MARHDNWEIRLGVASNPNTPGKILEELARDSNLWIREEVARNLQIPKSLLKQLAKRADENCDDSEIWGELAELSFVRDRKVVPSTSTTQSNLEALAKDKNWEHRLDVAQNPNTPERILEQLAKDDELWVRLGVARNPKTPERILKKLVKNNYTLPRQKLTKNTQASTNYLAGKTYDLNRHKIVITPQVDVSLLANILAPDAEFWIGLEVAGNANAPAFLLEKLAQLGDDMMFQRLASNPNTPANVLLQLVGNKN
ncbi:MAG TPA: hypothetical protein V6C93_00425, partial [Allocoleopsis sp.]